MTIVGQTFEGFAQHRQIYRQVNHLRSVTAKNTMPEKEARVAEPLLFIPGLNCTAALFAPQTGALGAEREVLFADHRQDATIAAIARRALDSSPERFALAGLSMGGYVALEILRQGPHRVTRVALLDTSARPDTEEATQRRLRLIRLADSGAFDEVHDELWPRLVHRDRQTDAALETTVLHMMRETGPEAFMNQQRAVIGRMDSRPGLAVVAVPALVLAGEQDVITPPDHAREMAEAIPDAELVIVPGCGHLSTLEHPEAVTDALRGWLAR